MVGIYELLRSLQLTYCFEFVNHHDSIGDTETVSRYRINVL